MCHLNLKNELKIENEQNLAKVGQIWKQTFISFSMLKWLIAVSFCLGFFHVVVVAVFVYVFIANLWSYKKEYLSRHFVQLLKMPLPTLCNCPKCLSLLCAASKNVSLLCVIAKNTFTYIVQLPKMPLSTLCICPKGLYILSATAQNAFIYFEQLSEMPLPTLCYCQKMSLLTLCYCQKWLYLLYATAQNALTLDVSQIFLCSRSVPVHFFLTTISS